MERSLLSISFQIFGASYAKLRPKCLDDLYTEGAKCGSSRNTPSAWLLYCVIDTMSKFKKRYKIFWITIILPFQFVWLFTWCDTGKQPIMLESGQVFVSRIGIVKYFTNPSVVLSATESTITPKKLALFLYYRLQLFTFCLWSDWLRKILLHGGLRKKQVLTSFIICYTHYKICVAEMVYMSLVFSSNFCHFNFFVLLCYLIRYI